MSKGDFSLKSGRLGNANPIYCIFVYLNGGDTLFKIWNYHNLVHNLCFKNLQILAFTKYDKFMFRLVFRSNLRLLYIFIMLNLLLSIKLKVLGSLFLCHYFPYVYFRMFII